MTTGNFFGELSLMQDIPASASIVANTIIDVHSLLRADFDAIVAEYPELLVEMHRVGVRSPQGRRNPVSPAARIIAP